MRTELPRHLTETVLDLLGEFRVVVVTGARQVGKSTLARAVLRQRPGGYLTLDQPDVRERAIADPLGLVSSTGDGLTVIDEVQLAPELLRAVKLAVDRDGRPGAFLLTGSANLLRMRDVSESLAGRAAYVELGPLTLSETTGAPPPRTTDAAFDSSSADAFLSALPASGAGSAGGLRDLVGEAVVGGGMPGTLGMDAQARRRWYAAYLSTFVERDLWQLGRVDDVVAFRRLYALAMLRTAGLLNRADLAADAALDHRTSSRYLDLLDIGYQLRTLPPYAASVTKRLVRMPKLFARDSGMAAHVCRVDTWADARETGLAGALFETWMLAELTAIDALSDAPSGAHFWRTSAGSEVDLLLERGTGLVGIEMKAAETIRWADSRALAAVRDEFGERFRMGVVAYLGSEARVLDDRIVAVPAWTLLGAGNEAPPARPAVTSGAAIVAARTRHGMRVAEAAALLGVDEATVRDWESTAYEDAPLSVVRTLAETLGVTVRLG